MQGAENCKERWIDALEMKKQMDSYVKENCWKKLQKEKDESINHQVDKWRMK